MKTSLSNLSTVFPAQRPIIARAQARATAAGSTVTMNDAVAAVRAARDHQEP